MRSLSKQCLQDLQCGTLLLSTRRLSLCTRYNTCFIHEPPEEISGLLGKWYEANAKEVKKMLEDKVYRDVSGYILPPKPSQIMKISEAMDTIDTIHTAWIAAKATLIPAQERVVYTVCSYCCKTLKADTNWALTCTHCGEQTKVKLRCHLDFFIADGSGVMETEIYSPYAEKMIGMASETVLKLQESGVSLDPAIEKAIEGKEIVCLIKFFDKDFRGASKRKFIVVTLFPASEVFVNLSGLLTHNNEDSGSVDMDTMIPGNKGESSNSGDTGNFAVALPQGALETVLVTGESSSGAFANILAEKQFFSPRTKLIIDAIATSSSKETNESVHGTGVKRALQLVDPLSASSEHEMPPPEHAESKNMSRPEMNPAVVESPGKKNKNHAKLKKS